MSSLLEKALGRWVRCRRMSTTRLHPRSASLADEEAWKRRFAEKRDVIRRMAQEALQEHERGGAASLDDPL